MECLHKRFFLPVRAAVSNQLRASDNGFPMQNSRNRYCPYLEIRQPISSSNAFQCPNGLRCIAFKRAEILANSSPLLSVIMVRLLSYIVIVYPLSNYGFPMEWDDTLDEPLTRSYPRLPIEREDITPGTRFKCLHRFEKHSYIYYYFLFLFDFEHFKNLSINN